MGTTPVRGRKGSWIGQRDKLGSGAVPTEASVNFMGRSEAGMAL